MLLDIAAPDAPVPDVLNFDRWCRERVGRSRSEPVLPRECRRSAVGLVGDRLLWTTLNPVQPVSGPSIRFYHWPDCANSEDSIVAGNEMLARSGNHADPYAFVPSVFPFAWHILGLRYHEHHIFTELHELGVGTPALHELEGGSPRRPDSASGDEVPGVTDQPRHDGMAESQLAACVLFERRPQRSDLSHNILHRSFHRGIRVRRPDRRVVQGGAILS